MGKPPPHSDTRSLTDGDYFAQNTKFTEHMFGKLYVRLPTRVGIDRFFAHTVCLLDIEKSSSQHSSIIPIIRFVDWLSRSSVLYGAIRMPTRANARFLDDIDRNVPFWTYEDRIGPRFRLFFTRILFILRSREYMFTKLYVHLPIGTGVDRFSVHAIIS